MFDSIHPPTEVLDQIRAELLEADPKDFKDIFAYTRHVREEHAWQRQRTAMIEKLTRIKSPWKRWLISLFFDFLILVGPIFNDDVMKAWKEAGEKRSVARKRTADFFYCFSGYPAMYFQAMKATWKVTFSLYGSALGKTLKSLFHLFVK